MANGLFDEKKKAEIEAGIDKMIAAGKSDDEIQAYIDQEKAKLDPAQAQQGAPAQADAIQDDTASNVAPGSSVSPEEAFETAGAQVAPETPIKDDAEIGGWENLKNNVENVYNRILGFDDRLALAAVDTFETLLGKDAAETLYKAMPTYDSETGEWLDTPDEVREAAYRELAQTQAQNKQTVGLIDSWENGDAGQVVSAAAGAGLNLLSTMVTSGLTAGAGLYTDMVADAIVDANNTKAETMGISTKELYERGENEFMLPAAVGTAGGLLERMGVKGVQSYINSVATKNIPGALLAMANNSGKEGLTEWLQYGLETYNNEKAKGNDDAANLALSNLFTREGAEMALQGAVGALVGGTAGKAGKRALGISQGVAQTPADELSEVQDTPEYGFDPKTSESKYKSKVKATEDAAEAGLEQEEVTPEQAAEMERAKKREKESQNRETRRLVQELEEEYEGTAQELNPTDKTAYVLRGLERDAGIKTVDEAADLSKSRQRDVMHLVTKASVGIRSAEETAKLDKAQENIFEASKILENTTDPAQQEALQLYIDDEKDKVANTITNYNRKVLLSSPTAVANAVEAANELDRLSIQEQNIQNNGQLPDAVKQSMLDNIQDRKSAAYQKGETARAEIEKSAAQNADLVDDNSKYLAQLLEEEIADNEKKTDAIVAEASDLGLVPDPDGDLVTDDSLSEGRQAISGENGVKEYGKTFGGNFGSRTEAIQAGIKLQQSAKTKGYKANVEYIDVNPERPGGDTQVVAEIYSPRQENVVESVNKLKNQQQAELEETDPVQAELDEAAEAVQEEERTPTDYVKDFAPEAQETALDDGSIFLPGEDAKQAGAYRAVGGLKKRGHKEAKFEQIGGGFLVRPGKRDTGEQIEYNIDESGRAHDAEGKFVPKSQGTEVARVKALPLEAEDGATFNLDGTVYEDGGLVVPIASKNMKASELTDEAIENFKTKYKDYMGPASKVGIYKFPGQDQVSIDLNVIAPSHMREEALKIGKALGQESLFDLDTFENIKTGETGANPKTPTANQARNIATDLSVEQDLRVPDARDLTQARRDARARAQSSQRQSRQATAEELAEIEAAREKRRNVIQEPGVPLKKRGEGEELTQEAEPYFNKDAKTQQIEDLKGRITDESIGKLKEGNPNEALVASIPYVRILAKNNQRNRDAALDPEIESVALAAASEAFINGEFQGRQFAPENADDAIKFLGGIVKDAVRDYYLGPEGAAAGIPQIKKDASTRLNKINSAISRLGTRNPVDIAEALNEGFTSIQEKKLKGRIVPGTKEADRYRSPEQLGQELGPGRAKTRFIQDEKITPQQVNDLLARQEGLTPHRIDVTPFDKIADDVTEGLEAGTGSIADVLGVNLETLPESNRDIAGRLNPKEVRAKLDDIINAVSKNPDTRKKIKRYVDREVLSQAQKARALKEFAAKLLNAERGLGKTTTPSQELDFSIEEGSATRNTDMGVRSKLQVNSHRQPWNQTAKELNRLLGSTNFNDDWVQWSPGQLGNLERGRAKGIPDHVLRELNKQPARVAKLASKYGASLRQDTKNPGVYHIYKPGKIGSKPDFSLTEKEAANTVADKDFINKMETMLNKAWPNHKVVTDPFAVQMKIGELQMNGIQAPWSKMKGFVTGNKVYLTGKAGYDTPIHEFAHVWAKQLMSQNPKLWKRGVELLKGSEYARAVYEVPTYKEYLKGNPSKFWEEVMANAIGKRGAVLFQNKSKQNAWDKWMKSMTNWLKDKLGISSKKDYQDLTLDDWLDVGVHGVFTGKATTPAKAVEYSIKTPEGKAIIESELEKRLSARAAKKAPKKGWFSKATEWMVPPAADDYHGLVQRFNEKFGKDPISKKLKSLTKDYVDGYEQFEKDATKARESFAKAGDKLADKLNLSVNKFQKLIGDTPRGKLDNYLAQESDVNHKGVPLSINEAIGVYLNPGSFNANLVDQVKNTLPKEILEFADNLEFTLEPGQTLQHGLLQHINKTVFKDSMSKFLDNKNKNFNRDVLNDIGGKMGSKYQSALEDSLNRMGGASGRPTDAITQKWNDWLNNSVGAIMFLNVRSAVLQGLSIWNYMSPGNMYTFNKDLAGIISGKFGKDTPQFKQFQELWNDPMLKERRARAGFDVNASEVMDAIKTGNLGKLTQKALNKGFVLTSLMDSVAIAAGGTAFVRQEMSGGKKSKQEALRAWREKTQEAQQSARPDRVSQQQKAAVSKFILAFANTPAQYFRLSQKAYRTIKAKGLTSPEGMAAARKIAYYMAIQNAIFTMAQSASTALFTGWGGEDDEQKEAENALNSMISTGLRGMGLYGAVLSAAKDAVLNANRESKKKNPKYSDAIIKGALQVSPPLNRKINQIQGIGRAYTYKQERSKTGLRSPHAVAIGKGGEALFNLPTDWTQKKLAATQALYEGDASLEEFLWMLGGYSEYSVLGKKDKDSLDLDLDLDLDLGDLDLDDLDLDI